MERLSNLLKRKNSKSSTLKNFSPIGSVFTNEKSENSVHSAIHSDSEDNNNVIQKQNLFVRSRSIAYPTEYVFRRRTSLVDYIDQNSTIFQENLGKNDYFFDNPFDDDNDDDDENVRSMEVNSETTSDQLLNNRDTSRSNRSARSRTTTQQSNTNTIEPFFNRKNNLIFDDICYAISCLFDVTEKILNEKVIERISKYAGECYQLIEDYEKFEESLQRAR